MEGIVPLSLNSLGSSFLGLILIADDVLELEKSPFCVRVCTPLGSVDNTPSLGSTGLALIAAGFLPKGFRNGGILGYS